VADFGVANSQALGERDWTIMLVEELGSNKKYLNLELCILIIPPGSI